MAEAITVPPEMLTWKRVDNFALNTCLGTDMCSVDVLDIPDHTVLKPGEDDRIRRAQIRLFCDWIISGKESIEPEQLRYILTTLELRQSTVAKALAVTEGSVSQFLSGDSKWKESTHRQLALLILNEIRQAGSIKQLAENKPPIDSLLDSIPVGALIKRQWITDHRLSDLHSSLLKFFGGSFSVLEAALGARFRASNPEKIDSILVGCWIQRLKNTAAEERLGSYSREKLLDAIPELLNQTVSASTVQDVKKILNGCGVHFLVEPALKGSSFDGAAFIAGKNPVVGLTLRYDRIDWFWFTLFHELAHVLLHDISEGCVDQNPLTSQNAEEVEANRWAAEQLVPSKAVEEFSKKRSGGIEQKIRDIAIKYKRHPGIIAGRLQHEGKIQWGSKICSDLKVKVSSFLL